MKIEINSTSLSKVLKTIVKVIPTKGPSNALLMNVLIEAKDSRMKLTCSNGESSIISTILPDKVEKEGTILVNAKLLTDYVNSLPADSKIVIEESDNKAAVLKWAKGKTSLPLDSVKDYPEVLPIKSGEGCDSYILDAKDLLDSIDATLPAAAVDDIRPVMCCVLFEMKEGKMNLVASDAHVLNVRDVKVEKSSEKNSECLIHREPATFLREILKGAEKVAVFFDEKRMEFNTGTTCLRVILSGCKYPAWRSILPDSFKGNVVIKKNDILSALKRSSVAAGGNNNVTFTVEPEYNHVVIDTKNIDFGCTGLEQAEAKAEGEGIKISYNLAKLMLAIENCKSDSVRLSYTDACRSTLVTCADIVTNDKAIVMPVVNS